MALNVGELYASFGIDSKGLDGQISGIEKKCQSIASSLTKTGAIMSTAITAPVVKMGKEIYKAGTSFEAQMSKVQAIAGLDSSIAGDAKAIEELTAAALEMGSTTQFTATEAGEALEYMAMAGWKTDSMLAGLKPIMDLAAASGEDLGRASDIVTDAMTAFGYTLDSVGGDTDAFNASVTHFTDVLAAAATNANTNVSMMGESFKYVAPLAGSLGYSVDDVAVALGIMANNGIKGSQAGTSLRTVLNNMIKPTDKQAAAMEALGLSLYDGNGKVKDFSALMQDMRTVAKESGIDMHDLRKEVASLDTQLESGEITEDQYNAAVKKLADGSADWLRNVVELSGARGLGAMLAIMNASDKDFDSLTEAITHCDGATAKMAQTMLDNAKGDVTIFQSAIEGLEITLWTLVSGPFRNIVQTATKWVDSFRKMNSSTQIAVMKMAGLAAAAGPVMLAAGRIVALVGKLLPMLGALVSPMGIVAGGLALMAIAAVDANNDIGRTLQKMSKSARRHLTAFNKDILSSFDIISKRMPALTTSLSHILKDDLPTAVDTLSLSFRGVAKVLSENSDDILGVGVSLIEGLATGISRNLPELVPAAVKMVSSLRASIIKAAPRIIGAAGKIALSLAKGLLNTDWLGAAGNILTGLSTAVTNSLTQAKAFVGSIVSLINTNFTAENISAGLTNAATFAESVFNAIVTAFGEIGTVGSEIVTSLVGAINGVFGNITDEDFSGKLGGLATTIINGIVDSLVSIGTAGSEILTSIINGITSILSNITSSDFGENMNGVAGSIMEALSSGIAKLGTNGKEITSSLVTSIGGLLSTITSADFLTGLGNVASTLIAGLGTAIGQSFQNGGEIIKGIATALSTALSGGNIGSTLGNLSALGLQIVTAIGEGIKSAAGGAATLISAIGDLISAALGKGANGESLIGDLSGLGTAIITAISKALSDAGEAATAIFTALNTALSGINWAEVGTDLSGLATSLISGIGDAIATQDFGSVITSIGTALGTAAGGLSVAAATLVQNLVSFMLNPANWAGLVQGLISIVKGAFEGIGAAIDAWKEQFFGEFDELLIPNDFHLDSEGQVDLKMSFNVMNADENSNPADFAQFLKDNGVLTDFTTGEDNVVIGYTVSPEFEGLDSDSVEWKQIFENYRAMLEGREPETITVEQPVEVETTTTGTETDPTAGIMDSITSDLEAQGIDTNPLPVTANLGTVTVGEGTDIQSSAQTAVDTALSAVALTAAVDVSTSVNVVVSDSNADTIGSGLGTDLGTSMATGISGQSGTVSSAAVSLVAAAQNVLSTAASTAYNSGSNIGVSLASGISSQVESVRSAAAALAAAATVSVSKTIQEGSPSKVMIRSGRFFGDGFVKGISDRIKAVKRQSTAMARTAIDALSISANGGLFGDANQQEIVAKRNSIDYSRLAAAMAATPKPVLELDGRQVASVNAENTARAQNGRTRVLAMRYGSR